jgi:transcriptional regulator with XRE-family HTH domain
MSVSAYAPPHSGERPLVKVPGLRRVRGWRVLTQAELSEKARVRAATISRLEHGGEANAATVRKLARALDVSVYDLTDLDPNRPPKPEHPEREE